MATNADKLNAERLFVQQGLSPEQVAASDDITASVRTVYNWRAKHGWDDKRAEWLHKIATQVAESEQVSATIDATCASIMSEHEVLAELSRIARGGMRSVATWRGATVTLKDSSELTDDEAAIVAEVGQTVTAVGGSLRIKLHSKQAALDALAKYYAGLRGPAEGGLDGTGNPDDTSPVHYYERPNKCAPEPAPESLRLEAEPGA